MILVDSNELSTSPDTVAQLRDHFPEQVTVSQLACGDLAAPLSTGLLLIERKTPGDFLGSIADQRLFVQVNSMVNSAKFALIIIQCTSFEYTSDDWVILDNRTMQWRGSSIRAILLAVQWAGCAVLFSDDYVKTVAEAIRFASKENHNHYKKNVRPKPSIVFYPEAENLRQRIEFIASIPGVGPERAKSLLESSGGTVSAALEYASYMHQLKGKNSRPAGWGAGTLKRFREFLGLNNNQCFDVRTYKEK